MAKTKAAVEEVQDVPQQAASSVANVSAEALAEAFGKMLEKFTPAQQSQEALADAFVKAVEASRGIRQVSIGERGERGPFNPKGRKRELKGEFWANGWQLRERTLSDEEIALLHEITPGRYIDKFVTVIQTKRPEGPVTQINWPERTPEQRLEIAKRAPTFTVMLKKIVEEGKQRDALLGDENVVKAVNILMENKAYTR